MCAASLQRDDQTRRLYDSAIAVRNLRPWQWMLESDVFGVSDPISQQLYFVSIMGARGEHLSVAVYLGESALHDFLRMENSDSPPAAGDLFAIPHLQASFEDRSQLDKEDRAIIKQLGLRFRGRQAWPQFRSYRPGFFPWFIEGDDVETLTCALDQVLEVAPRFRKDPLLLRAPDIQTWLVRTPERNGDRTVWTDQFVQVPPPDPVESTVAVATIKEVRRLPERLTRLEVGLFPLLVPIQAADERPACPHVLMVAEAGSGIVVGVDLLQADNGMEAIWERLPEVILQVFIESGVRPSEIAVGSDRMVQLLSPACHATGVKMTRVGSLAALQEAMGSLVEHLLQLDDLSADGLPPLDDPSLDDPSLDDPQQEPGPDWQPGIVRAPPPALPSADCPFPPSEPEDGRYRQVRQRGMDLTGQILAQMSPTLIHIAARDMGLLGPGRELFFQHEAEESLLLDRCLYDIRTEGATLIERFMASDAGTRLDPENTAVLQGMAGAHYSLFEVTAVMPEHNAIDLSDLLNGGQTYSVTDINLSHSTATGMLLATRLIRVDDLYMTTGNPCTFDGRHRSALLRGLKPKAPAAKRGKGRKPRSRPRCEYSAYFFKKYRLLGDIRVRTVDV